MSATAIQRGEVSLRAADASDALCLHALATQVFFETYATAGIRGALVREAEAHSSLPRIATLLADPAVRIVVAERAGHLLAFAELHLGARHSMLDAAPSAELVRLYVLRPFLRQGIGGALIDHAEALASAAEARVLWLTAWVGNTRALAFYASRGYEDRGSTPYRFGGESFENRLFVKPLGPRD